MSLDLFVYDLMSNFLPGSLLVYYFYINDTNIFNWVIGIGDLKKEKMQVFIFLIISYLVGNIVNCLTRKICKFSKLPNSFSEATLPSYEECKNKLRLKNIDALKIQEKMESKYLLFRNIGFSLISILAYDLFKNKKLEIRYIFIVLGIIICLIKFLKYWRLSGKTLKSLYLNLDR